MHILSLFEEVVHSSEFPLATTVGNLLSDSEIVIYLNFYKLILNFERKQPSWVKKVVVCLSHFQKKQQLDSEINSL